MRHQPNDQQVCIAKSTQPKKIASILTGAHCEHTKHKMTMTAVTVKVESGVKTVNYITTQWFSNQCMYCASATFCDCCAVLCLMSYGRCHFCYRIIDYLELIKWKGRLNRVFLNGKTERKKVKAIAGKFVA